MLKCSIDFKKGEASFVNVFSSEEEVSKYYERCSDKLLELIQYIDVLHELKRHSDDIKAIRCIDADTMQPIERRTDEISQMIITSYNMVIHEAQKCLRKLD